MKRKFSLALAALAATALSGGIASPLSAQDADPAPVTPNSIVDDAAPGEWVAIAPQDLLVMELAPDATGEARMVVIQLIPAPFSQGWVENIRTLARAHWWDGTSLYRVVDNWVTQWGDVSEEKPLPDGLRAVPHDEYVTPFGAFLLEGMPGAFDLYAEPGEGRQSHLRARLVSDNDDPYAAMTGITRGWPIAIGVEPDDIFRTSAQAWPVHCYGSVGVARDLETTGTGSELYTVIGTPARALDRNIAVVGRVIEGMEHLSTLKRGTGEAGVYEDRAEDTPILSVRLASDLPEGERPQFEYLGTDSASFARYVKVRANRDDPFYRVPAGGVDICNVRVPIRRVDEGSE